MANNEKINVSIDKDLWSEIKDYAKENGLSPTKFANELLKKSFIYEKYGDTPFSSMKTDRDAFVNEVLQHLDNEEKNTENVVNEAVSQTNEIPEKETKIDETTNFLENIILTETANKPKKRRLK
jgi:antitoxin component of RelBE/YafQ-DinJ toxin-antitoxin module